MRKFTNLIFLPQSQVSFVLTEICHEYTDLMARMRNMQEDDPEYREALHTEILLLRRIRFLNFRLGGINVD